jgi:hypothetical protein
MKRYTIIFLIGLWVIVIPFLGVPILAKKILLAIPGAFLILVGILMSQEQEQVSEEESGISYAEAMPQESRVIEESEEEEEEVSTPTYDIVTDPEEFQTSSEVEHSDGDE